MMYCQFHSGLPLRPVYCTVSFTGSSIRDCPFVLCIALSVSLDRPFGIAPSSCVLYCQFHWIVHSGLPLRPVYCTVSFTGLSIRDCPFVLCIVLSVSLDRPFGIAPSSCVLYCQFTGLSIPDFRPVYCTVIHGSIRDCPFVLCIVLSISLDRPFGIAPSSCVLYCSLVSLDRVPFGIRDCPFVLCIVLSVVDRPFGIAPSSCVLYCQFHWIVHSGLPLRPVYCTVSFTGSSIRDCPFVLCIVLSSLDRPFGFRPVIALSIRDCPFVLCIVLSVSLDRPFGIAPSSCVLYCQFHWIVHSGLPLRPVCPCVLDCPFGIAPSSCDVRHIRDCPFVLCIVLSVSLDCPFGIVHYCQIRPLRPVHSRLPLRPVYCTVSFTGSSIRDCPFVLCIVLSVSLDRSFGIGPSSCVLYCQAHWIVPSGLPLRPVYCTVRLTGSSIRDCPFVLCIVPSVSLDRPFGIAPSSCVLYCKFHWIVHSGLPLPPVYCTVSFTGSSIRDCPFILCIVLSVSLDCPFRIAPSSCVLYCQFHGIVHSGLPLRPVYCPVSFTGLSIRDCPFVLCIVLSVLLDRPFGIALSS